VTAPAGLCETCGFAHHEYSLDDGFHEFSTWLNAEVARRVVVGKVVSRFCRHHGVSPVPIGTHESIATIARDEAEDLAEQAEHDARDDLVGCVATYLRRSVAASRGVEAGEPFWAAWLRAAGLPGTTPDRRDAHMPRWWCSLSGRYDGYVYHISPVTTVDSVAWVPQDPEGIFPGTVCVDARTGTVWVLTSEDTHPVGMSWKICS
jgi:hypothetical protein